MHTLLPPPTRPIDQCACELSNSPLRIRRQKPTSEAITKYTEQQTATDRLAASAYAPACDQVSLTARIDGARQAQLRPPFSQVAKLLGSATPSSEQIKAYCARTAPAAAAADGELSAADLKLLAELEGQTALLAKQLCGIASGVDTARDALDKVGAASGLKPLTRTGRRGLVACEEAAAKAATPRTVTAGQSPVWTGLVGALNAGSLSVDPQDTVLVRLCALVSAMAPAVKVAHRGPSSITYAKGTVSGTTSVLFALFPALLGKDRATQAKVCTTLCPPLPHPFLLLCARQMIETKSNHSIQTLLVTSWFTAFLMMPKSALPHRAHITVACALTRDCAGASVVHGRRRP